MQRKAHAFTLVELLVVIAIISALMMILFPLMSGARASAHRVACISNLKQIGASVNMYATDYDDRFMPTSHNPATEPNSRNDRTWVQLVLPYVRSFSVFRCPADYSERPKPEASFDQDLVPGDTDSRFYTASMRTNYGFNYHYLSPIVWVGERWQAMPRSMSDVQDPSQTIMLIDSVWSRTAAGQPVGGGSWLVTPPCRYHTSSGRLVDTFVMDTRAGETQVFATSIGWSAAENSTAVYGNAWPWHSGRLNVARVDGSVDSITPGRLSAGCDVREQWQGEVKDMAAYPWDLR